MQCNYILALNMYPTLLQGGGSTQYIYIYMYTKVNYVSPGGREREREREREKSVCEGASAHGARLSQEPQRAAGCRGGLARDPRFR